MHPVNISTEQLSRSPRALAQSATKAIVQQTRFADLPLPARLLLAVPRLRGPSDKTQLAERYVLDTLGRIIDAGPDRRFTIEAVNLFAEVLLSTDSFNEQAKGHDRQWLSSIENLVLCVLCKVRSGQTEDANKLTQHWLESESIEHFNVAAAALCDSGCFKCGGAHVFTPGWSGSVTSNALTKHCSVDSVEALSLGESLLLNAVRVRMRTLPFGGINSRVLPLLSEHLAVPGIESLVDAHLMEALQYCDKALDVRCLCCSELSADEARLLASMAAFSTGDSMEISLYLKDWLPVASINRLQARMTEFQSVAQHLGTAIVLRDWDIDKLEQQRESYVGCEHSKEPSVSH